MARDRAAEQRVLLAAVHRSQKLIEEATTAGTLQPTKVLVARFFHDEWLKQGLGGIHWGTCETRFHEAVLAMAPDSAVRLMPVGAISEQVFVPADEANEWQAS
jgi:hypothetical protein